MVAIPHKNVWLTSSRSSQACRGTLRRSGKAGVNTFLYRSSTPNGASFDKLRRSGYLYQHHTKFKRLAHKAKPWQHLPIHTDFLGKHRCWPDPHFAIVQRFVADQLFKRLGVPGKNKHLIPLATVMLVLAINNQRRCCC